MRVTGTVVRAHSEKEQHWTAHGDVVVTSIFEGYELEVLEYKYREGYFYLVAPTSSVGIKTYEIKCGSLELVVERETLTPGDLVVLKPEDQDLHVNVAEGTCLLVHAFRVKAKRGTLERMAATDAVVASIQAKDGYTGEHSLKVQQLVRKMAVRLGYVGKSLRRLLDAARFHDVGKIHVPDQILNKPANLTHGEYEIIKRHVLDGESLVRGEIEDGAEVWQIIEQHHERLDGTGYPYGLAGDRISAAARILAVADVFDAMTTHRIYRAAKSIDEAVDELLGLSERQFDRSVVATLIEVLKEDRLID